MDIWFWFTLVLSIVILVYVIFIDSIRLKKVEKNAEDKLFKFILQSGFNHRVLDFKTMNQTAIKDGVVFVGDSITQEWQIHEYFSFPVMYNRGIGGDTTEGLLTRLEASVFALKPKVIVLQMGTNDFSVLGKEAVFTITNLTEAIKQILLKLPAVKIFLVSVYPIHEPTLNFGRKDATTHRLNQRMVQINQGLKTTPGVTFVDVYPHLLKNGQLDMAYSRDGLHLNAVGYQQVKAILEPYLNQLKA
jgi:lysophospholipase L1-like esterase